MKLVNLSLEARKETWPLVTMVVRKHVRLFGISLFGYNTSYYSTKKITKNREWWTTPNTTLKPDVVGKLANKLTMLYNIRNW